MLKATYLLCFLSTSAKLFICGNPECFLEVAWRKWKTQAGTKDLPTVAHPSTCFFALGFFSFPSSPILLFLPALSAPKTSCISLFRSEFHLMLAIPVLYILKIFLYQTVWASSLFSQACNSLLYYISGRCCAFTHKNTEISVKPIAVNIWFPQLGCFAYNWKVQKYRIFHFLHPQIRSQHDLKVSVYEVYTWTNLFHPKLLPLKSLCL